MLLCLLKCPYMPYMVQNISYMSLYGSKNNQLISKNAKTVNQLSEILKGNTRIKLLPLPSSLSTSI